MKKRERASGVVNGRPPNDVESAREIEPQCLGILLVYINRERPFEMASVAQEHRAASLAEVLRRNEQRRDDRSGKDHEANGQVSAQDPELEIGGAKKIVDGWEQRLDILFRQEGVGSADGT